MVELSVDEWVLMSPQDNRCRSHQQANKMMDDAAVIDLIQRVRYVLRVRPIPRNELPLTGEALYVHGLILHFMATEEDFVTRVCAMNVSDKLVKVYNGMKLINACPLREETAIDAPSDSSSSSQAS